MAPAEWLTYLLLGGMLGAVGQIVRVVAGLKKSNDNAQQLNLTLGNVFEWPELVVSILIGFAAGLLASLALHPGPADVKFILAIITAGYAGTDFIEAFVKKHLPSRFTAPQMQPAITAGNAPQMQPGLTLEGISPALPRSARESIESSVIIIVARYVHADPEDIKLGDLLSYWQLEEMQRRDLAQKINLYFQNVRHEVFDHAIHGDDTKDDRTVGQLAQLVRSFNPRPR